MSAAPGRLVMGPFNRVEGDLEVQLDVAEGRVQRAQVCAPMYRGFETMLLGRDAMDALTIVPRICGICSVSQSVAAAQALAQALQLRPPPNGQLAINLMHACENLADHLTHFYVFFMPDFTRDDYATHAWHARACQRFAAVARSDGGGEHSRRALAARTRWLELMGTLGGKWPHTGAILPGGSSRALEPVERQRLLVRVREMRFFLERTVVGTALEDLARLDSLVALDQWRARAAGSDLALFLEIADDLALAQLGRGPGLFLSYGCYAGDGGEPHWARGVWNAAGLTLQTFDERLVSEDVSHAWLADGGSAIALHPAQGVTVPMVDKPGAYTWNKAPRLGSQVVQTGALARQLVAGHELLRQWVAMQGAGVSARVLARWIEVARLLPMMEGWLSDLKPRDTFHTAHGNIQEGAGVGLTEAARGALGHWLRVEHGRIAQYQIIAPTSWNFSPRDLAGQPGALEAALVGAPVSTGPHGLGQSVAVQHIVRSFDPCMVCTVH